MCSLYYLFLGLVLQDTKMRKGEQRNEYQRKYRARLKEKKEEDKEKEIELPQIPFGRPRELSENEKHEKQKDCNRKSYRRRKERMEQRKLNVALFANRSPLSDSDEGDDDLPPGVLIESEVDDGKPIAVEMQIDDDEAPEQSSILRYIIFYTVLVKKGTS
jgi:hypothetical protein